jgi:NADP-dependent 3-hydroxy acid dehydrogenase YdfG
MNVFGGQFAVVTGASSGIGRAIAESLAAQGASLALVGRDRARLEATRDAVVRFGAGAGVHVCDLSDDGQLRGLIATLTQMHQRIDLLVHAAAVIQPASLASTVVSDFDRQYRTNVRAPFMLTQGLLPAVTRAQGQIVFINSSVGLRGKENVGAYAATKHALKAIADTLRMEVNALGIRVLSVYAGTTATAMQQSLHERAGTAYRPEVLLQPPDIATAIVQSLSLPRTAEVTDLYIRSMIKPP